MRSPSLRRLPIPAWLSTLALLGLGLGLAGCGATPVVKRAFTPEPYYTWPPRLAARPVPPITRPMMAVCNDGRDDTAAKMKALVEAVCTDPVFLRNDLTGDCTLRLPVRTTYFCKSVDHKKMVVLSPVRNFLTVPHFQAGSNEGPDDETTPPPGPIEPDMPIPGPHSFPGTDQP